MTQTADIRVLITGAKGFVGDHLVTRLKEALPQDADILLADRYTPDVFTHQNCRTIDLDVTDSDAVSQVILNEQPTHLIHLAAVAAVTAANRDQRLAWKVNFGGTQNIALAISEYSPSCRLLFCSSAEVYGASFIGSPALDEAALLQPVNTYGAAKAAADIMLGQMALSGLQVLRLRPFNHTGPKQSAKFAIPSFALQIAKIEAGFQKPVLTVGDLQARRDFLDVQDVVDAYTRVLLRFDELPNGSAINIASGVSRSLSETLEMLLAHSRVSIEVNVDAALLRQNDIPVVCGDASRAREWLGWAPQRSWADTLQSTLDYWRQQSLQNEIRSH